MKLLSPLNTVLVVGGAISVLMGVAMIAGWPGVLILNGIFLIVMGLTGDERNR